MIIDSFRGICRFFYSKMPRPRTNALIPDAVRGMKQLDREKFSRNVTLSVVKLSTGQLAKVMPICKPYILKLEKLKPVQNLSEEHKSFDRFVLLNPNKVTCWDDMTGEDRQRLIDIGINEDNFDVKELQLTYENFSYHAIFNAVLPEGESSVSGFSQIGHIIHLNLRDHLVEYKYLIGTVLLDKIKSCRTVINKRHVIDNTYRNFDMELLAGEKNYTVEVKENKCYFQFDFSKVYWNPRLTTEHERILYFLKPGDILFDVFCGVGPFAVPAANKRCRVFANDLNPESYKWLNQNAKINNINMCFFKSYNLDGQEFICKIFKDFIIECCKGKQQVLLGNKIHVTMNLPALAMEFIKHFKGLIDDKALIDKFNLDIFVYVYCFCEGDNPVETTKQRVIEKMGESITSDILDIVFVRNVSPTREMMKVALRLTKEILFGIKSDCELTEPPTKKKCVENVEE